MAKKRDPKPEPTVSLKEHILALMAKDEMFDAERDRRYGEVNVEKEKALKIKETADLAALELARQIQTYKDEQHNGLLKQLDSFVAKSVTQTDLRSVSDKLESQIRSLDEKTVATIKPISDFVSNQQGKSTGLTAYWGIIVSLVIITGVIVTIVTRSVGV